MVPTNAEHFTWQLQSNTWQCNVCFGNPIFQEKHVTRHEQSRGHTTAVTRYIDEMNRSNSQAILNTPQGVIEHPPPPPTPDFSSDFALDSLILQARTGILNPTVPSPSHRASVIPRTHTPAPPTPPAPTVDIAITEHHSSRETLQDSRRVVIEAVQNAIDKFVNNSDESDDEVYGDIEEEPVVGIQIDQETTPALPTTSSRSNRKGPQRGPWSPWPDRISCTIDVASRIPRSVMSDLDKDVSLWLLSENGVPNVPSLWELKQISANVESYCGMNMKRHTGSMGHTYYVLQPSSHVEMDFANPTVRAQMEFYPEKLDGQPMSRASQAQRWLEEMDGDYLTPMYRKGGRDFYVFEPTLLDNGSVVMPTRFFRMGSSNTMWFDAWPVTPLSGQNGWLVDEEHSYSLHVQELSLSGDDLWSGALLGVHLPPIRNLLMKSYEDAREPFKPWDRPFLNPWRLKAGGRRVFSYPMWLYCDDTSGNRSKKWNEHNSFLMVSACLPREAAHREVNVHFLCTSNAAPPLEMMEGIVEDIESSQKDGIWVYDSVLHEMVLVVVWVLALLGDNPMQSEFACHAGLRSKFFCRVCWVKGKDTDDMEELIVGGGRSETEDGLIERVLRFMKVGRKRTREQSLETTQEMLDNVVLLETQKKNNDLRVKTGVKDTFLNFFLDKIEQRRKNITDVEERENVTARVLNTMPRNVFNLNPHQDTPVEILHVVLLGYVKYFWRDAIDRLSDPQKVTLKHRLSSLDLSGLDPAASSLRGQTLVQYAGSLVGRDFQLIQQVAIFALYDLLDERILSTWAALSALIPYLWQPQIDDLEAYLIDLQDAIDHFLECTAHWTPRWFNKPKFHLLLHLPAHIRRFGPAILFATEVFESFNAVIRAWSIHSNRLAPSRDIAMHAAHLARIRHFLSGGYFRVKGSEEPDTFEWLTAGAEVLRLGQEPSVVTRRIGLFREPPRAPGITRRSKNTGAVHWDKTQSAQHAPVPDVPHDLTQQLFRFGKEACIQNLDIVQVGSFVILCSGNPLEASIGEIIEILTPALGSLFSDSDGPSYVLVKEYEPGPLVPPYSMPKLILKGYAFVPLQELACAVNVQHNCAQNRCDLSKSRIVRMEREDTTQTEPETRHRNVDDRVLNISKIRDARFLRKFLPKPVRRDREQLVRDSVRRELDL
ncbi:hypothetical protein CC1G_15371 [Coprinopsis cinerea okayama7|uniref:C2H2-type domain-containing protein n=1 Tax=Coprinopsis cinerea (strain Okayama-7 / 130 / ATCC MYA-4618 / FGSC 9003) TaxID=240176 RepID=D6RQK2_COPC7|nr:hypothetical protein CC1G_15371 [Coprinopsis cinerea okayama7\|eukprot:XP_002910093.1 hypothetical protein CC1G_15371 [Coprinopsis cinerea okayama7\